VKLTVLQKVLWLLAIAAAVTFAVFWIWFDQSNTRTSVEEPAFEAVFELTDHRGVVRTQEDFAGRWMLVFFGFTNCPDICPTTLSEVAAVMDGLGDDAGQVQPIFITVDPERDTPMALAEYVPLFDSGLIGLTGTPDQIKRTSQSFPIFYDRIEEAAAPDGYTMSHTSHLFLFDSQAGFADSWPYSTAAEEILADIQERL